MSEMGLTRSESIKLWYDSKTKKETLDLLEYQFVSVYKCLDELIKEIEYKIHVG